MTVHISSAFFEKKAPKKLLMIRVWGDRHVGYDPARQGREQAGPARLQAARSITFQMAEVMVSHDLFKQILDAIGALRPSPLPRC
jgi:hypothetical protein